MASDLPVALAGPVPAAVVLSAREADALAQAVAGAARRLGSDRAPGLAVLCDALLAAQRARNDPSRLAATRGDSTRGGAGGVGQGDGMDVLLTVDDAARRAGVSRRTLERHGLPTVRIGRARRVRLADLDAWLADRAAS